MTRKVLCLGNCAADTYAITNLIENHYDAQVIPVDTFDEALLRLSAGPVDLIMVNRVLNANGASGLTFIRQLKEDDRYKEVPVMLISNFADAQKKAEALGAIPGFGKAALHDPHTFGRLVPFLGEPSAGVGHKNGSGKR